MTNTCHTLIQHQPVFCLVLRAIQMISWHRLSPLSQRRSGTLFASERMPFANRADVIRRCDGRPRGRYIGLSAYGEFPGQP